ncbi:helix-turn-helix domain-containing protein [Nibricoccus sp. IMCC34717]|uniref:helix-turn-helix transcriptional regulator n=1 Tax=Nibricoccus sp. IMCC34717 TaxID=3034021 RepID=UPI00384E2E58
MALPAPVPRKSVRGEDRASMRDIFQRYIKLAERSQLRLKIPRLEGLLGKHAGMHFHFKPELFIQLQGRTRFQFLRENFDLCPGEVCIMPAGVPHGEKVCGDDSGPFRNLVAGFYSHTMSVHFAHEVTKGRPDIEVIKFFDAPDIEVFLTLTNALIQSYHMQGPARDSIVKGLLLALLGMFHHVVATASDHLNEDVGKVFQVKWIVREQLSNPDLSVRAIAQQLQCSADYLSNLFHRETGERLTHYLQRIRIEGAVLALETSPLYISEIGYASGFSDPAYFSRVFRKLKGVTPQEFRGRLEARRSENETRPKTVFEDRVDYTHGEPV